MTANQKIFAFLMTALVLVTIVELVRRRKLAEEYAWLWLLTSGVMITLVGWYDLLARVTHLIGAVTPTTTLFLFGLLFLLLISVHFSIVVTRHSRQVRRLAQELALVTVELSKVTAELAERDRASGE